MAGSQATEKVALLSKTVQELAINCKEPPEKFIYKEGYKGIANDDASSLPLMEIPVIDLQLLSSSSPIREEEEKKLQSALSSWGFFQAINHGMSSSFLDEMREVIKQFFALPTEEKKKCSRTVDYLEGYGNDTVLSENQTLDWTDRLYLMVNPEDRRHLKFWPENPEKFREVVHEYTIKSRLITELLLKAMARSLNLEDDHLLNQYGERPIMFARFNFFPPCPRPDHVLGVKAHADGSAITILLPDKKVEGLQFLKDDLWFKVPIIPHALIINVGDQVEIMTNGVFKSPLHRVVTNTERERISLAMFCIPEQDKEIEPADELINEKRPRLYKKVKNYVELEDYFLYYQQGKRPIDIAKL